MSLTVDTIVCRRIIVRGSVQGVGFRAATLREALRIGGLSGFVRNLNDGSVELVAQGPSNDVSSLETWARRGPPSARVTKVSGEDLEPSWSMSDFEVR